MNSEKAFVSLLLRKIFFQEINILSNRIYFVNFLPKVELHKWFSCRHFLFFIELLQVNLAPELSFVISIILSQFHSSMFGR